jgi:hypothetical protein
MGMQWIKLFAHALCLDGRGIHRMVANHANGGMNRKYELAMRHIPRRFKATITPAQSKQKNANKSLLRRKTRSHIQARAKEASESPAPTLKEKKTPPKKAGPNSWSRGMIRSLGTTR